MGASTSAGIRATGRIRARPRQPIRGDARHSGYTSTASRSSAGTALGAPENGADMDIMTDGPTLVLSGDFDVRSTLEVRTALHERLDGHEQDVVVDLTEVDHRRRHRARVLAYASREAGRTGHHLTLRGCGPAVRRMLHLSRLMRSSSVERRPLA